MLISFIRTVILYSILILVIRLMGKRQLGEMEPMEFVVTMLLANLAAVPMQETGIPLLAGLIPILVVLSMELLLSVLVYHSVHARRLLCGKPVILMENGRLLQDNMKKTRITPDELTEFARMEGITDLSGVKYAILETGGQISILPYTKYKPACAKDAGVKVEDAQLPVTVISDGHVLNENLPKLGKPRAWVDEELREYLKNCPKYGNNLPEVDQEVVEVATRASEIVRNLKNYLGNTFRPDWSSPSTHLTYGYLVGATPDGRGAREMLGYGIDPLFCTATSGLGFRTLSTMHLPFCQMEGGCASHFGIDPKYFTADTYEERGLQFRDRVLRPLFFNPGNKNRAPFYLYVNVTTADTLRKVLADPKKYAPNGVYIMRIHGTFVNFLDLSPAIQQDIITRLDPGSTFC